MQSFSINYLYSCVCSFIWFPFRSDGVLEDGFRLLEHMTIINKNAKEAVALGDGTLKEANDTYETLTGKKQK